MLLFACSDNKIMILKTLAKAVLPTKSLLKVQADQLVWFLLDYHSELFKVSVILPGHIYY